MIALTTRHRRTTARDGAFEWNGALEKGPDKVVPCADAARVPIDHLRDDKVGRMHPNRYEKLG